MALDAAGYGPITITKNVTLTANPGFYAGIAASAGNAVTIATAGINVILRGLNINGAGAGYGINMTSGASLTVENCVISNFTSSGIFVDAPANVRITDSIVRGNPGTFTDGIFIRSGARGSLSNVKMSANGRAGLMVQDAVASVTTTVAISDSDSSGNAYGFVALATQSSGTARITVTRSTASENTYDGVFTFLSGGTNAVAMVGNSLISGNAVGLSNTGGLLESLGNNIVRQNDADTAGTITTVSGL